jgi:hypothetical protein
MVCGCHNGLRIAVDLRFERWRVGSSRGDPNASRDPSTLGTDLASIKGRRWSPA